MQATALLGWPGAEVRRGQSSCSAKLRECQSVSQVTPAQHSNIALEIEGDIMPALRLVPSYSTERATQRMKRAPPFVRRPAGRVNKLRAWLQPQIKLSRLGVRGSHRRLPAVALHLPPHCHRTPRPGSGLLQITDANVWMSK